MTTYGSMATTELDALERRGVELPPTVSRRLEEWRRFRIELNRGRAAILPPPKKRVARTMHEVTQWLDEVDRGYHWRRVVEEA